MGESTERSVCAEHSGLTTWVKVGCMLLSANLGVYGISSFYMIPALKEEFSKTMVAVELKLEGIKRDVEILKEVDRRIMNQRNLDHPNKDQMQ